MNPKVKLLMVFLAFTLAAGIALIPKISLAADISWSQLNTNGFGDVNNQRAYAMATYNNNLYAGTLNTVTGAEVWKYDGTAWTQVNTDGFGAATNYCVDSMIVFNNKLYAGVEVFPTGAEIWQYDGTTWTQANTDGFGDPRNFGAYAMKEFNSKLFVSTYNIVTGTEVWQLDGATWTQVNTDGFGSANSIYSDAMAIYNNKLLVGAANAVTGGQLWQYDGATWTMLNGDGFGDTGNREPFSMLVDGSLLYVGTANTTTGTEAWKYDGTAWTQINADGFGSANNVTGLSLIKYNHLLHLGVKNEVTGGEVWQYDGTAWTQANTDGFGDVNNTRAYSLLVDNHKLYSGTANTVTGAEVWVGQIADTTPPTVSGQSPASGATAAAKNANIDFFADDALWPVDTATIDFTVAGHNAIIDGAWQTGYSGSFTSDGDKGYAVSVNPASDFLYGQSITVTLSVADELGNNFYASWSFTVMTPASLGMVMSPASAGGPNVRVVDAIGTQISTFFAYDQNLRMGLQVEQADFDNDGTKEIVVTPGMGVESYIKAFELDGTLIASTLAFNKGFTGGVSLTTGDFNSDNKDEIVVTPASAGGPNVRVYTLNSSNNGFTLLDGFFAYATSFRGGVNLSAGDLDGDNIDELVVAPISKAQPEVKIYKYSTTTGHFALLTSVIAYQNTYLGGVQLATGDINGDGKDDVIVSPYLNGGPNIRVYQLNSSNKLELLTWILAYQNTYRGTLSMSVGDLNGDGLGEIVLAPKSLGDSTLKVYKYLGGSLTLLDSFLVYDSKFLGGVNLFVSDIDNDGYAEVMASPASNGGPNVRVYDMDTGTKVLKKWFWAFPIGFRGGVNFGK